MHIYGLKTCDTCRKAARALLGARLVDIREASLSEALLDQALAQFGADLVNTRSTTWRGMDAAARGMAARDQLRAHPTLMKRPLIVTPEGLLHLGWGADVQAALGV